MSGALRPGTFIRLDETAAKLGVSVTPVREALLKLRGEGMVQLEPHRGHVVLPLTRQDIDDIFWLQATIAKELAATASQNITDAEIDDLERITDALATAVAAADTEAIAATEFAFHRAFNHATGRIKLAWFLLHVARYMPLTVYAADPQWGAAAVENHRAVDRCAATPRHRRGRRAHPLAIHRRRAPAHQNAGPERDLAASSPTTIPRRVASGFRRGSPRRCQPVS